MEWISHLKGQGLTGDSAHSQCVTDAIEIGCRYLPPECFVIGKEPPKISSKVSIIVLVRGVLLC